MIIHDELQKRVGYRWRNVDLLVRALTHSTYGHEHGVEFNERDEFLGDSVLDLLTAEHLMHKYPNEREGFMSQRRAEMVMKPTLAARARTLGLPEMIRVGCKSEQLRQVDSVLCDAFEALIGSLYQDGGLNVAREALQWIGVLR